MHGLYLLLQIVYWYNPLLWLVRRHLHHLRELSCDGTVAELLRERTAAYRQTLLETARRMLPRPSSRAWACWACLKIRTIYLSA